VTIHELWQILLRRRWAFFACLAIITLAAVVASLVLPTRYEGVGRLTVDFESSDPLDLKGLARAAAGVDAETKLQTQVNILQTDSLAWDVIKRLRLDQQPETAPHARFLPGRLACMSLPNQSVDSIGPECRRELLDEFHKRLHVQSVPRTQIIEVRFRCKSPELAAKVVNSLTDAYVEKSFQTKYQASMRVSSWLSGQLDEVKQNAELAEEKYISYQKQNGIIGTDENHNVLIERLGALNQQLVVAEANRIVREARYRVAMNGDPEALAEITPGTPLQLLHAQETTLNNEYAELNAKFGDAYPRVTQVKAQLDKASEATKQEVARVRDKVKTEYESALQSESMLRGEFEQQKQQAYNTNEAAIQVALLKRDVDADRELYEELAKKLNEAGILAGLKAANVTVIDPATVPVSPVEPQMALNLALGLLVGSVFGVGLCFLQENIDTTITSPNDVAGIGSLSSVGIVPRLNHDNGRGRLLASSNRNGNSSNRNGTSCIASLEYPESEVADAYRSLRTTLLLTNAGAPPKILLITSALPREGKTTTSVNAAVVFAQKNRRVLLVDGDLRRADLQRCLNISGAGGLSSALVGEDPKSFYVPHPELPSLMILPAGERPPKPPDLLDSDRMRELVSLWRQEFDHVIIDAPPIIGMSDAVILSTMVDTVLLVVRAQQCHRHELFRAHETLANVDAKVAGALINDFSTKSFPYGYGPSLYNDYFGQKRRNNGRAH
jgi:polysaccharide biosynthesis transport protein